MIFERWDTQFDIPKLRDHIVKFVLPLEPVQQSVAFGGWSVLSSTGGYTDGWTKGHKVVAENMDADELRRRIAAAGMNPIEQFVHPTEICHGYLNAVIETLRAKDLQPRRARIIRLRHGLSSIWHRDAPDNIYAVRLHVPIVTNPGCIFETESEQGHLAADGASYFLRVNRVHRVRNDGDSDRLHLVVDVRDSSGVSQFHRYP